MPTLHKLTLCRRKAADDDCLVAALSLAHRKATWAKQWTEITAKTPNRQSRMGKSLLPNMPLAHLVCNPIPHVTEHGLQSVGFHMKRLTDAAGVEAHTAGLHD